MADLEVRPSKIQGLGVFALRSFRAGERIHRVNVVREITPEAPLREDLGECAEYCNYPDGKVVLWGSPDRHVNHSCNPNARVAYESDACLLVARRDIASGDEITCDYNLNITGGTAWPCHCGTGRCTGIVVGDFFRLPPERQHEYRAELADWFIRHYHDRLAALEATAPASR